MADFGNTSVFSQTDASNTNIGTGPGFTGTMAPSGFDDNMRKLQGAAFREWNWRNVTLTTGGTSTAYTLTYSVAPSAYYNGQVFGMIFNAANGAAPTLNVNSLGAKAIKINSGGALVTVPDAMIRANEHALMEYNTAGDCFVWLGAPSSNALDGWSRPIVKLSTSTISLNTVAANDSELFVTMAANTRYQVRGELAVNYAAGGGIKIVTLGPTAPTQFHAAVSYTASDATNGGNAQSAYGTLVSYLPAGTIRAIYKFTAVIEVAGTAGTLNLAFAQNTSHATSLVIYRGSFLEYKAF